MAQGKATKSKTNLPPNSKHKSNKTSKKNSAFNKRKSVPVPKKIVGKLKLQDAITKTVNRKNEDEMKKRATSQQSSNLSKAQQAVAKSLTGVNARKQAADKGSTSTSMAID